MNAASKPERTTAPALESRSFSLAYLSAHRCNVVEAFEVASHTGYANVGLRLWPNAPGAPHQKLLGLPEVLRETLAVQRDTGVGVLDLEIIRINDHFDPHLWDALYDAGAALGARSILVAGDDMDAFRLSDSYARLCEIMAPFGLNADLEFMPWTGVPDARSALAVVLRAGTPANAGILVDAMHFGRSSTSLEDIRAIPRSLLHYAQVDDVVAGTGYSHEQMIHSARCERLLPGEGTVDLIALFSVLPTDLPLSVEIVNLQREQAYTPAEWAHVCLNSSRNILQQFV